MSELLIQATPALLDGWTGPACRPVAGHPRVLVQLVVVDGVVYEGDTETREPAWLDLSRAECRDWVARVLAAARKQAVGCTAPAWGPLGFVEGYGMRGLADTHWHDSPFDPDDDTRLPDGSRRVDALALAAVWREVSRGV